jgi:carbamate kinase
MPTIRMLVGNGAIVICSGGGGIPVCRGPDGLLHGVEAVIDKDLTAVLLARTLGTDHARPIFHTTPDALRTEQFPAGSMGPKVDAACRFVEATGHRAFIGRLDDAIGLLHGTSGTVVEPAHAPFGAARHVQPPSVHPGLTAAQPRSTV